MKGKMVCRLLQKSVIDVEEFRHLSPCSGGVRCCPTLSVEKSEVVLLKPFA